MHPCLPVKHASVEVRLDSNEHHITLLYDSVVVSGEAHSPLLPPAPELVTGGAGHNIGRGQGPTGQQTIGNGLGHRPGPNKPNLDVVHCHSLNSAAQSAQLTTM